ncbi:Uncharacterized membrane protein [Striga hermonthica]|uniref:Uncharacterized membrane protein n=1 Tax=Striga hermonthica TaxID=68872 RepID=A0A9N7NDG6_STRHE|nr:Uncharacterized membrane protein [Striga hermonthica]
MANPRKKGKFLFLSVLSFTLFVSDLLITSQRLSCPVVVLASNLDPSSNSNSEAANDHINDNPSEEKTDLVSKHDVVFSKEVEKLQELVQNLTQLVARLESHFNECPLKVDNLPLASSSHRQARNIDKTKQETEISTKDEILQGNGLKRGGGGAKDARKTVFKYNTFWSEKFQFVSAVKLQFSPTILNVLPFKDQDGVSKYFSVGDYNGKLMIFSKNGDVSLELDTFSDPSEYSPVTAVVSVLSVFKNETLIATGHENGIIVIHRVWEASGGSDDWKHSLRVERVGRFETPGGARINLLEAHQMGRKRYIIASDDAGKLRVLGEDGSLYGSISPGRRPVSFLKQRLLFLTETGAGSLDLRNMRLKETECEGLNNSFVRNYVFDVVDRTKAYGLTSDGDLVHTLLLGDAMNFKCRVRSKRRLDLDHHRPVALQAIRGYLLLTNKDKVHVYNVSTQHYVRSGGPRHVFSVGLDEILSSFLNQQAVEEDEEEQQVDPGPGPLVAGDYEKIIVLSLGNGYVAMYRSNLPVFKNEFNSILWTSPVLFFIVFLFVVWHFFANKKDALTSWGPDDPFVVSSSTSGGALGPTSGLGPSSGPNERSGPFGGAESSSRSSEIMDLRAGGSGLRAPTRYVSSGDYATSGIGGSLGGSYRVGGGDLDPRLGQMDARFRNVGSELKYRTGPHVDGGGVVMKRREAFYVNSQVVDER